MIHGFNRSITFPMMNYRTKKHKAFHVRSLSLPCKSHPLIANLEEQIRAVRSWAAGADSSLPWIEAGLLHIELLLLAVIEFLNLSETKAILRRNAALTEHLLERFLYLIDSYGSFFSEIVTLRQHNFELQSALRRHDFALLSSSVKSQRRTEKELSRLATTLHATCKSLHLRLPSDAAEADVIGVLVEAISATSAASLVLFNRVVAVSEASSNATATLVLRNVRPFKKRVSEGEKEMLIHAKFEELEGCVEMVERGGERVLRSLVNSRVLLLNIQSELL